MASRIRIIAIPGSMNQSSVSLSLIRPIIQNFTDRLNIKVFAGLADIPHFNPDLDNENPPENLKLSATIETSRWNFNLHSGVCNGRTGHIKERN